MVKAQKSLGHVILYTFVRYSPSEGTFDEAEGGIALVPGPGFPEGFPLPFRREGREMPPYAERVSWSYEENQSRAHGNLRLSRYFEGVLPLSLSSGEDIDYLSQKQMFAIGELRMVGSGLAYALYKEDVDPGVVGFQESYQRLVEHNARLWHLFFLSRLGPRTQARKTPPLILPCCRGLGEINKLLKEYYEKGERGNPELDLGLARFLSYAMSRGFSETLAMVPLPKGGFALSLHAYENSYTFFLGGEKGTLVIYTHGEGKVPLGGVLSRGGDWKDANKREYQAFIEDALAIGTEAQLFVATVLPLEAAVYRGMRSRTTQEYRPFGLVWEEDDEKPRPEGFAMSGFFTKVVYSDPWTLEVVQDEEVWAERSGNIHILTYFLRDFGIEDATSGKTMWRSQDMVPLTRETLFSSEAGPTLRSLFLALKAEVCLGSEGVFPFEEISARTLFGENGEVAEKLKDLVRFSRPFIVRGPKVSGWPFDKRVVGLLEVGNTFFRLTHQKNKLSLKLPGERVYILIIRF